MKKKLSLGDRMKEYYEKRDRHYLTRRVPVILRLDGKAFHTFTRGFEKPFSDLLQGLMSDTAKYLCENIQGAKLCYTQSDEITIVISDYDKLDTDAWFGYETSKMNSIAAGMASAKFNRLLGQRAPELADKLPVFDCRAFNIPENDVANCILWRYQDWASRNSISMLTQSHFSHKEMHCKSTKDMHEMLFSKGINWNDLHAKWKNGTLLRKNTNWTKEHDIMFIKSPGFYEIVRNLLNPEKDD